MSGGAATLRVPRPTIGSIDFANDHVFLLLCTGILAIVSVIVVLLRSGTTGRFLDALRGSEIAAMSIGVSPARQKLVAFAISAAIAGLGGGLLVTQGGVAGSAIYNANFVFFVGLVWVVLVVTLGSRTVQAAIFAGMGFVLLPELLIRWFHISPEWSIVLFGLGALTYAKHPEGIIEANTRSILHWLPGTRS